MTNAKPCVFWRIGREVVGLILFLILVGLPSVTSAALALQWDPPTNNTDRSRLKDLSHYRLRYGFESRKYTFSIITNTPNAYVNDLKAGSNYYFAVVAVNSKKVESDFSNEFIWKQPLALEILTSANAVTVPEGSTASFLVKLNAAPVSSTTVRVSRVSGDTGITVRSGASLVFNASSWNTYQTVTLSAAEDLDIVNSSAVIRCSAAGITNGT